MKSTFPRYCEEEERCYESEKDEGLTGSEDEIDREEIEQALYAQIHYCQDENVVLDDNKDFDVKYFGNGEVVQNKIKLEDKQFSLKTSEKRIKTNSSVEKCQKMKDTITKVSKGKSSTSPKDDLVLINSSDSDLVFVDSDIETDDSSEIDYDIDSDCMMLDESCDDMGDIVLNINENQKNMVHSLTIRNMKDKEDQGTSRWSIIDEDRFSGNPLLKRYHRPLTVRCHNCNEVGHLSKVCPKPKKMIVCYLCGESGHHGKACPNPICFNCNKPGHVFSNCTSPRRSRYTDCHRCQMLGHASYECPEIWRQFHLTTTIGPLVRVRDQEQSRKHCPNCAGDDHFDYECEEERMDRHYLPTYPFISQYRKSDVRVAKRHRERLTEDAEIPAKRRKLDPGKIKRTVDNDFIRSPINYTDTDIKSKKRKSKNKGKEKKEDNFRNMMDNDDFTFRDKKNKNNQNARKNKQGKKGKKSKKNNLSLEEQYYGPLPVSKKKKKKSKIDKKSKKDKKSKPTNASKGFKVRGSYFHNI